MNELVRTAVDEPLAAIRGIRNDVEHQCRLARMNAERAAIIAEVHAGAKVVRAAAHYEGNPTVRALRARYFGKS